MKIISEMNFKATRNGVTTKSVKYADVKVGSVVKKIELVIGGNNDNVRIKQ